MLTDLPPATPTLGEKQIQKDEKMLGWHEKDFSLFMNALKRIAFKENQQFENPHIRRMYRDVDLDYDTVDDTVKGIYEGSKEVAIKALRNDYTFQEGKFSLKHLAAMVFLNCQFSTRSLRREEFWLLVNPELKDTVTAGEIKDVFKLFVDVTILMRLDIEKERDDLKKRKDVVQYLDRINKIDVDAQLMKDFVQSEDESQELTKEDFLGKLEIVHLNAAGFRMALIG